MLQSHSPSPSRFPFNTNSNDSKTESIVKNFYIKTAQTIIQSRQQQQQQQNESIDNDDGKKRMNRWFNMNTREYPDSLRSELKYWITRAFVSPITQPPPLIIEIYLDISNIPLGKQLALKNGWKIIDLDFISSSSSSNIIPKKRIILENWILTLNHPLPTQTLDLGNVYKRSILFFRTLYAFTRLLPLYQNTFKERTMSNVTATEDQQFIIDNIGYRLTSSINNKKEDEISLDEGPNSNTTITQDLDSIVTPLGTLGLQVHYRANCDFIIHDPLDINTIGSQQQQPDSSAQLMDLDYNYFTPTIAKYTDNNKTIDSSDDDKKENEIGDTFKTITKAVNKNQTITQWPPIPRKSESARVATTTETTSLSRYHHQRRQTYNNEHRPASSSSSSSSRHTTHNNAHRPRSFSLRPLSINDEDNLFIKSVEPPSISPSSSSRVHHISPFKSPTLSSSSQHSSTFSLRSMRGTGEDDKKSTKSNITRRFSSSFDYRHTDRYYHSAPSEGNNEIQTSSPSSRTRSRRSFSVARRSSIASDQ
ncbi:autophagy-related protein 13-domain-containing protein [Circinella umbellata]|nr:autophagy-related protein 13-domain-containing protein [Circinella umbellata]